MKQLLGLMLVILVWCISGPGFTKGVGPPDDGVGISQCVEHANVDVCLASPRGLQAMRFEEEPSLGPGEVVYFSSSSGTQYIFNFIGTASYITKYCNGYCFELVPTENENHALGYISIFDFG